MSLWPPLLASFAASIAALIASMMIVLIGRRAERAAVWLLSFAVGTLIGAAALVLLPEALEHVSAERAMPFFAGSIVVFIAFERVLRWRHTHEHEDDHDYEHHPVVPSTAIVILWGDALHNFVDGIIIGVAFRVSTELGIATAVAIFAHELPQEIGDFCVLLASGMKKGRAILLNYLAAATIMPGALLASMWRFESDEPIGILLAIAAGGFLYIALADLVPSLHHRRGRWAAAGQLGLVVAGMATIALLHEFRGH
ncbi:MAG TPA: ZIP family metal transporter [Thermoanaerobaculia bacterium]|nr:ZIP family metal transporter [Thermoanaerobaculia bacterium]